MLQLDHTDLRLLKILHNDSKLTVKELAAQVNLSPSPVFERIRRMEKEGYIKKYIAILDAEKLNQGLIVFCNIRLKQHDRNIGHTFVDDIHNIDEVVECYNVSGDYDFLLKVHARDMKHYQDFVFNKLGSLTSIGNTHSTFVMAEVKNTYGVQPFEGKAL
ncbi:Lrp/AsnC family transcriptional regulator [Elizabethkingia anophelis]|uniref:AsnC family transcriptional regulator n=3 Tax=Elizabethkingia anophelis TaxID=1117645 RepID=A0A1T3E2G6_9FLAO|nr:MULTISPECIES: Lrp/AsnC family transcriptional regulator [Elizabethkingia]AIL44815.1 Transcriptional regulator, AsnC family [Elizabethkingia anophelis NUHP1]AMR39844.1 AsnC family transcriptional regulator [Elizabethkingia anophelis]AMX46482.1 AsnC family transcriptional regulator [Elizabethkingia anophelis]AMX49941.1 AsnC family transcriptional regulator [Elizabethkingia anophelis]AMX53332.1 AsnC family transcriptional regulator [Elizabethkingia anophelis]